jgi:hypothetical protein
MEKEAILHFKGKYVDIHFKRNNFVLAGYILEVYSDSILFQTKQTTSAVPFSEIYSIKEL